MRKLKGKRVLITGGAGGIGLCTAEEFAKAGAEPIITDIDENALARAADKLRAFQVPVHTRRVDVTDRAQVEALARWVEDDLGGLDILINNAGIGHSGELIDTTIDEWERLIKVNLCGPLYHVYAFLPAMIARGEGYLLVLDLLFQLGNHAILNFGGSGEVGSPLGKLQIAAGLFELAA